MVKAKEINAKEFARGLKPGALARAYLFLGEETGLMEKMIGKIRSLLADRDGAESVAMERFHAENGDLAGAADFALSRSMFSPKKLAVIYEADTLQVKQNRPLIEELFSGLPDSTTLVLISAQNKAPRSLPLDLLPGLQTVRFWRYFESDMAAHIRDSLKREKMTVSDGAVSLLIRLLGRDLGKVDGALEKLKYSGQSAVTEELVTTYIDGERNTTIFEFLDALFMKSTRALTLLKTLLDDGVHELVILTMITRQCESIERYHRMSGEGKNAEEILKELGIQERNREGFISQVSRFGPREIGRAYAAIHEAESLLKGAAQSKNIIANPVFELATRLVLPEGKAFSGIPYPA
jgi:DNA polymerase III delta subunit